MGRNSPSPWRPSKTRHVFDERLLARLAESCDILSPTPLEEFSSHAARRLLRQAEILVTGWGCPFVSREVLAAAPQLRLIAHAAGTVKHTLDPAVIRRGHHRHPCGRGQRHPSRRIHACRDHLRQQAGLRAARSLSRPTARAHSTWALMDEPIGNYRRTVGLVGASRIGRRVAALLQVLDVEVLLADPFCRRAIRSRSWPSWSTSTTLHGPCRRRVAACAVAALPPAA